VVAPLSIWFSLEQELDAILQGHGVGLLDRSDCGGDLLSEPRLAQVSPTKGCLARGGARRTERETFDARDI
jgi:hypothetical protein